MPDDRAHTTSAWAFALTELESGAYLPLIEAIWAKQGRSLANNAGGYGPLDINHNRGSVPRRNRERYAHNELACDSKMSTIVFNPDR